MSQQLTTIADLIPLTFWIGGVRIRALKTFKVTSTLKVFLDDAKMSIANPKNALGIRHFSTNLRLGSSTEVKWEEEVMFSGTLEEMESGRSDVTADPSLSLSAREAMVDAAETDIDPKPERTITDNAVLQEVFGGGFTYELDPPVTHKKFSMHSGETAAKAAERVCKLGGFMVWTEGTTIYKRKPTASGTPVLTLDAERGHLKSYKVRQSIEGAKSKLVGYAASERNEKVKEQRTIDLTLTMRTTSYTPALNRTARFTQDKGDQAETRSKTDELIDTLLPEEEVDVEIEGLKKVPLNSLVHLRIPEEAIDRDLLCIARAWDMDIRGVRTTSLTLILPGRKTWR